MRDRHTRPPEVESFMVHKRSNRRLEMLIFRRDRQRQIHAVVFHRLESRIMDPRHQRMLDRPTDHAIHLRRRADPIEPIQILQFPNRRLTRRARLRSLKARIRNQSPELRREHSAHQTEPSHTQRDHGLAPLTEQIERFEIVAQ